ncbi:MAG: zinc metallopeptidase [Ruminococcaceae bacterium]|nr:zinc metallopeptidase [Oscillospiraceae bacterium]
MFWIDYWYIIFVIPPMLLSIWASFNVKNTFNKYKKVRNRYGLTGEESARKILDANGLYNVRIERISGDLTDHYDPRTNVIRLSDSVYGSDSVAAVGVAAHEAGHAVQHATEYTPIKIRSSLVPVANFGSSAGVLLAVIGIFLANEMLSYIGIALFMAVVLFQLVTLPVEFDASNRAIKALERGYLSDDELKATKKVLGAAALTYLAALLVSIGQLLRLIMLVNRGNRD